MFLCDSELPVAEAKRHLDSCHTVYGHKGIHYPPVGPMLRIQTVAFQLHKAVRSQSLIERATVKLFLKDKQCSKHANIVQVQAFVVAFLLYGLLTFPLLRYFKIVLNLEMIVASCTLLILKLL